jgi:hypothetical protein
MTLQSPKFNTIKLVCNQQNTHGDCANLYGNKTFATPLNVVSGCFKKTCIEHTANVQSISTTRILSQRDGETQNTLRTLINSKCTSLCYHVNVCLKKGGRKNTEDNKNANCSHLYVEETKEI